MNILFFLLSSTIKCKNCIHYIENSNYHFLNKCSKFERFDFITQQFKYDYADLSRENENKCGIVGKYFEEKINK